ncbi:LysR family transcriptional regulator [Methylobacterium isbiliense]|jgi:LysR family nitrogen assimilation transcriptional regulator|uniref:HTH-type transcriptional regulator HdfR n=1 Tax=Methylobacterium isbiliense TaxID=315478 RepID=A0ABQ4SBT2_9HYPH|nr:LysR family transcriptional regulator [Methylobacterium isbiliense]MDN3621855.1 LysR family transcriptional regulator [Methylobacterium isbiliense]GJD99958.1 HTH-type transcriptional regulator HdfR [Methylobacterium isbiliense]
MDLRDLRVFVAIAETGSLVGAAEVLHIGPPSLSARLKGLEEELRAQLFHRRARGLVLTEDGRIFLAHAYAILKQAEEAKASLSGRDSPVVGAVRFGIPGSLIGLMTGPLIERCVRDLPQVRLKVVESMSGYIADWLRDGTLDAAVVFGGGAADHTSASLRAVAEEELHVATYRPDLIAPYLDGSGCIAMANVARLDLVMPGLQHGLRILAEATARSLGHVLRVTIEVDATTQIFEVIHRLSASTICSLAALHQSTLPASLAAERIHTFRVVSPGFTRKIYLAMPLNRPSSRATLAVTNLSERMMLDFAQSDLWQAKPLAQP